MRRLLVLILAGVIFAALSAPAYALPFPCINNCQEASAISVRVK